MHNSWAYLWHYLVSFTDVHWGPRYPVFSFNWTKRWWQQASLNHTFKIQTPVFYISMSLTYLLRLGLIRSSCLCFPHSQNRLLLHAQNGYHNNKFGLKFNFQPFSQNGKNIWQHCCCVCFGNYQKWVSVFGNRLFQFILNQHRHWSMTQDFMGNSSDANWLDS